MKLVLILFVVFAACSESKTSVLNVKNMSSVNIDSCNISVQSSNFKIFDLKANESKLIKVPIDSLNLNGHDFRIQVVCKFGQAKDSINGFYYTDLSGIPANNYSIIINNKNIIIQRNE